MWGAEVARNTYLQWILPNNKDGPTVGSKPRDTVTVGHSRGRCVLPCHAAADRTEIHPRTGGRDARNLVVVSPGPIT